MPHKQRTIFWSASIRTILVASAITFALTGNGKPGTPVAPKIGTPRATQSLEPEFKQRIRVFVHRNDIRPKIIHAWPGKAIVSVENESQADVSLQIESVLPMRNQSVGTVSLSALGKRLPQEVTLAVGEYVFHETSRPNIRGRLIVEAH